MYAGSTTPRRPVGPRQNRIGSAAATFEEVAPTREVFYSTRLAEHHLVALDDTGRLLGWATPVPASDRCAYAGVVEHSVYVDPVAHARGVGLALLQALPASTDAAGRAGSLT
ncbi:GNAT family N-acetyltransferase [Streptomyces sp. DSM 15324]|uniref:GNAT family N-acetyltransferase n=1 Tax=Streptomyces sp. DSM 15324 TaxID=1739111 RepID=UPI00074712C9|nr:GNAT family N-acetyltransferase [Streptomyces sp. DSM 15324]KUO04948.1 hypothetical protein AQJ58_39860 [Streptomyces sp. DSM 15324]